jgi:hypothetical protein
MYSITGGGDVLLIVYSGNQPPVSLDQRLLADSEDEVKGVYLFKGSSSHLSLYRNR